MKFIGSFLNEVWYHIFFNESLKTILYLAVEKEYVDIVELLLSNYNKGEAIFQFVYIYCVFMLF